MALKARSEEGDGKDNGEDQVGGREGKREGRGMGGEGGKGGEPTHVCQAPQDEHVNGGDARPVGDHPAALLMERDRRDAEG